MIVFLTSAALAAATAAAPSQAPSAPMQSMQHGDMQHGQQPAMDCCKHGMKDCCCCEGKNADADHSAASAGSHR